MTTAEWNDLDSEQTPAPSSEPTREQVKSFWWGVCGLATMALMGCFLTRGFVDIIGESLQNYMFRSIQDGSSQWSYQQIWVIESTVAFSFVSVLCPSVVMASIIPILYWRGGLMLRFGISLVVAICVMNVVSEFFHHRGKAINVGPWIRTFQIVACWIALPLVFLNSPIRTAKLRLLASSMLFTIGVCISILARIDAPRSDGLFAWQAVYVAGFSWALFRRNWGSVAAIERGAYEKDVERTSSRTLIELMIIAAIALVTSSYFSGHALLQVLAVCAVNFLLGFVAASVSIWVSSTGKTGLSRCKVLFVSWTAMTACAWCVLIHEYFFYGNYRFASLDFQSQNVLLTSCAASVALLWMFYLWVVSMWLKFCGWRIQRITN